MEIFNLYKIFDLDSLQEKKLPLTIDTILQGFLILILAACVTVIPLILSRLTVDSAIYKTVYSQILVVAGFALWILRVTLRKRLNFVKNPVNIPILALLIWSVISLFLISSNKYEALRIFAKFASYYLFFFILIDTLRDHYKFNFIFYIWLYANGVIIVYGLMQRFGLDIFKWEQASSAYRILSTFGNSIFYGNYLIFVIPIFLLLGVYHLKNLLLQTGESKNNIFKIFIKIIGLLIISLLLIFISLFMGWIVKKVTDFPGSFNKDYIKIFVVFMIAFYILICFLMTYLLKRYFLTSFFISFGLIGIYSVILTKSRGAWIGLAACIFFVLVFLIYEISRYFADKKIKKSNLDLKRKRFLILRNFLILFLFSFILLGSLSYLLFPVLPHDIKVRLKEFNLNSRTVDVRFTIMSGALKMIKDKPVAGFGIGSFQVEFPPYRPTDYMVKGVSHNTINTHNEYLQLASETGIVGLFLFLFMVFTYFMYAYYFLRESGFSINKFILLGFTSSVFGVLSHSIVSVSMRFTSTGFSFYLFIAFTVALINIFLRNSESNDSGQIPEATETESSSDIMDKVPVYFFGFLVFFVFLVPFTTNKILTQYWTNFHLRKGMQRDRLVDTFKRETNIFQNYLNQLHLAENQKNRDLRLDAVNMYKKFLEYYFGDYSNNIFKDETDRLIIELATWKRYSGKLNPEETIQFKTDIDDLKSQLILARENFRQFNNSEYMKIYKKISENWISKTESFELKRAYNRNLYILDFYNIMKDNPKFNDILDTHRENLKEIEKTKQITPENLRKMVNFINETRSIIYINKNRLLFKSIKQYETAIDIDKSCMDAYYKASSDYFKLSKPLKSLSLYEQLQQYAPNYTQIHYNKGIIFMHLMNESKRNQDLLKTRYYLEQSKKEFETSYSFNPYFVPTVVSLAAIYNEMSEYHKTEKILLKAIEEEKLILIDVMERDTNRYIFSYPKITEEVKNLRQLSLKLMSNYIALGKIDKARDFNQESKQFYQELMKKEQVIIDDFSEIIKKSDKQEINKLNKSKPHHIKIINYLQYSIDETKRYEQKL